MLCRAVGLLGTCTDPLLTQSLTSLTLLGSLALCKEELTLARLAGGPDPPPSVSSSARTGLARFSEPIAASRTQLRVINFLFEYLLSRQFFCERLLVYRGDSTGLHPALAFSFSSAAASAARLARLPSSLAFVRSRRSL